MEHRNAEEADPQGHTENHEVPPDAHAEDAQEALLMPPKKDWVKAAIGRPGALHEALHVPPGQKIPAAKLAAAAKRTDKVGQEARLAVEMRTWKHPKKGK